MSKEAGLLCGAYEEKQPDGTGGTNRYADLWDKTFCDMMKPGKFHKNVR